MALSSPVRQWGLLTWNKRWITFENPVIKLYKSETGPEGEPIVTFDLSDSACKFEVDPVNANRLSLDNSIALIHIKFDDAATRGVRRCSRFLHSPAKVVCPSRCAAETDVASLSRGRCPSVRTGIRQRFRRSWRQRSRSS